jgi:hypothetical protein
MLKDHWCYIIVRKANAAYKDKSDDENDNFYEKQEPVFDHTSKYHMKILLGDFNLKKGQMITSRSAEMWCSTIC